MSDLLKVRCQEFLDRWNGVRPNPQDSWPLRFIILYRLGRWSEGLRRDLADRLITLERNKESGLWLGMCELNHGLDPDTDPDRIREYWNAIWALLRTLSEEGGDHN